MAHSFKFIYWKVCCYLCASPKSHHRKRNRSSRAGRYSETRGSALPGATSRDYDTVGRKIYGSGATDSPQFDRQKSYLSSTSTQHSLPRNQHIYDSGEVGVSDAYKVPIISNKYVTHPMDSVVKDMHHPSLRHLNSLDSSSYHPSSPVVRTPPAFSSKLQDPMSSAFVPLTDELDYDDSVSVDSDKDDDDSEASVPIMLCISIVVGYICGGAILFSYWEGWEYSDSCYFCFITLTTIGFGDMVPGTAVLSEDAQLALGLCSLYLLFGMALLAMSFNLVQEEVTKSVRSIGKRIGILSDDDDDDDDDI